MENIAVNIIFTIIMLGLAIWDFISYGKQKHRDFKSIIMSAGVLGTFVGIFIGLQDFDVTNIESSVPYLLAGLKTAFYTSILGMALAILLSVLQKSKAVKSDFDNMLEYFSLQMGKLDELTLLKDINSNLREISQTSKNINEIQNNIKTTQLEYSQMQNENIKNMENNFSKINETLKEAMHHLAQGASKELIGALEGVIKDFNMRITEQFGDNFKELNAAVTQMINWQNQYKDSITSLNESLKNTLKVLETSKDSISLIASRNSEVLEVYNALAHSIEASRIENEKLSSLLSGFSDMHNEAQNALNSVNDLTKSLESSQAQTLDITKNNLENIKAFLEQSTQEYKGNAQAILQNSINNLEDNYDKANSNLLSLQDSFSGFNEKYLNDNKEILDKFLEDLNSKIFSFIDEFEKTDSLLKHKNLEMISNIQDSVNSRVEEIKKSFLESLSVLEEAQKQSLLLIEEQANKSDDILIKHTQNMESSLETASVSMQDMTEKTKENLLNNVNALEQHIANAILSLDSMLGNSTKTLQDNFNETKEVLISLSKEIESSMLTTTKSLDTLLNDTADTLSKSTQNIEESFIYTNNVITENLKDTTDDIGNRVKELIEHSKSNSDDIKGFMNKNLTDFSDSLTKNTELIKDYNSQVQNELRSSFGETYKNALEGLSAYMKNTTNTYQAQINKISVSNFEELKKNHLQVVSSNEKLQQDLQNRLSEIAKSTESFGKELLVTAKDTLQTHSKEVIDQYSSLQSSVRANLGEVAKTYLDTLSILTNKSLEVPKNVSTELVNEFNTLQKRLGEALTNTYQSLDKNSQQIDTILKIMESNIASSLSQTSTLNENLCKSLGELDGALGNITLGFRQDYEWFLRRIRELMGARG